MKHRDELIKYTFFIKVNVDLRIVFNSDSEGWFSMFSFYLFDKAKFFSTVTIILFILLLFLFVHENAWNFQTVCSF